MEDKYPYQKTSKYYSIQKHYTYLEENYFLESTSNELSQSIKNITYINELDGPEYLQKLIFRFADGSIGIIERFGNRRKVIPDDETYDTGFTLRDKLFFLSDGQREALRKMCSQSAKTLLDDILEHY
jgi:hypothetical protein